MAKGERMRGAAAGRRGSRAPSGTATAKRRQRPPHASRAKRIETPRRQEGSREGRTLGARERDHAVALEDVDLLDAGDRVDADALERRLQLLVVGAARLVHDLLLPAVWVGGVAWWRCLLRRGNAGERRCRGGCLSQKERDDCGPSINARRRFAVLLRLPTPPSPLHDGAQSAGPTSRARVCWSVQRAATDGGGDGTAAGCCCCCTQHQQSAQHTRSVSLARAGAEARWQPSSA